MPPLSINVVSCSTIICLAYAVLIKSCDATPLPTAIARLPHRMTTRGGQHHTICFLQRTRSIQSRYYPNQTTSSLSQGRTLFQLPSTRSRGAILSERRSLSSLSFLGLGQKYPSPSSTTKLFQNMNFSGENGEGSPKMAPTKEDDPLKWEKMYSSAPMQQSSVTALDSTTKSDIRVITFDLDNTIWKTSATISDANDALSKHLEDAFGIKERSEKKMGQLFKQFPNRYAGVDYSLEKQEDNSIGDITGGLKDGDVDYADIVQNVGETSSEIKLPIANTLNNGEDDAGVHIQATFGNTGGAGQAKKKPVYLTLLRKDAIRSLILEETKAKNKMMSSPATIELEHQVDSAFEIWIDARCQSISRNFAPFAVSTLTNLRSQLTSSDMSPKKVYIGAITDGNSNPNRVTELSGIFDFVIRAEDVGASKPDRRVYKAAVAALMLQLGQDGRSIEEFFLGEKSAEDGIATDKYLTASDSTSATPPSWKDIEDEALESFSDAVGPWWVHIGDDFFKDVVAAKEFQMRTVWTRELIIDDRDKKDSGAKDRHESDAKTQRSVTDLVKDVSKSDGVLQMSIGASEFLSESVHEEFSDAILDRFGDLSGLLMQWHEEGRAGQSMGKGGGTPGVTDIATAAAVISDTNEADLSNTEPAAAAAAAFGSDQQPTTVDSSEDSSMKGQVSQKFCVFCGEKIPAVAKFCSSCGERQI